MALRWTGVALAALLVAGNAAAQAPGERFTPAAAPIVALPRLTPATTPPPGTPPLTPGVVWEHPPEATGALSPVTPPGPPAGRAAAAAKTPAVPPVPATAAKPSEPPAPSVPAASPAAPPPPAVKPQPPGPVPAVQETPAPAKEPAKAPPARRTVAAAAGVYLRATPDGNGRVLDTVEKGERVEAFGAPVDGWQRVGRQGRPLGYVSTGHLAEVATQSGSAPPAPLPGPPAAAPAAPKPGRYAKADREDRGCALPDDLPNRMKRPSLPAGSVVRLRAAGNLRVAPVCDAKVLDVLEEGERITVLEAAGSWYRVGRGGRALGYVGAALLTPAKR